MPLMLPVSTGKQGISGLPALPVIVDLSQQEFTRALRPFYSGVGRFQL
jgi:hypothetical protein